MDKTVTVTLPLSKINVVLVGLAKLPIETALDTFNDVRQQVETQVNAPVEQTTED